MCSRQGAWQAAPTGQTYSLFKWRHLSSIGRRLKRYILWFREGVRCLIAAPEVFGGDPESCEGFVVQCELYFWYQPLLTFHTKVTFVISRLTRRARAWGSALVVNSPPLLSDYSRFLQELKAVFHHPCWE
uniref:DUF4939 domain-containing protein n=1 Tax=Electrophorus electricus TaxID=8005 RepID=A0AAY5EFY5_ELEEL